MQGNQIPFGERDGVLFRAYEVENGLKCGCLCPSCKRPLNAANNGEKVSPYFRHAQSEGCSKGYQEGVRRAAVSLIADRMEITLPGYQGQAKELTSAGSTLIKSFSFSAQVVRGTELLRNTRVDDVPMHAVFKRNDRTLLIRIKVSSRNETERYKRIAALDFSSLEIDLHRLSLEQINDKAEFEQLVLNDLSNRSWIRSLRAEGMMNSAANELIKLAVAEDEKWKIEKQRIEDSAREQIELEQQAKRLRAEALLAHRDALHNKARMQSPSQDAYRNASDPLVQRQNLIIATRLQAAKSWSFKGSECSACYLISPPFSRFCAYCASDSEMHEITVSSDIERTIFHQMRSSAKPARSLNQVPALILVPDDQSVSVTFTETTATESSEKPSLDS